jgi:hypothetical protein
LSHALKICVFTHALDVIGLNLFVVLDFNIL